MAKKKLDMSKLTLGNAKPLVKKTPTTGDEAVAKIHKIEPAPVAQSKVVSPKKAIKEVRTKEVISEVATETAVVEKKIVPKKKRKLSTNKKDLTRITVDVNKSLHKRIKIKALNQELSIREYIINLIDKDMQKK